MFGSQNRATLTTPLLFGHRLFLARSKPFKKINCLGVGQGVAASQYGYPRWLRERQILDQKHVRDQAVVNKLNGFAVERARLFKCRVPKSNYWINS